MTTIEAISSTVAGASIPSTGPIEPADNATLDKDAFLKLLVAQLKYQDPTAPTDVSQMMQQTSSLSMVERLDQIAVGIERMSGGALTSAASMLGREVSFDLGFSSPVTAVVDAVRMVEGDVILSAGGHEVPLDALVEVAAVSAASPAPATSPAPAAAPAPAATPAPAADPAPSAADDTGSSGDQGPDPEYDTPDY